MKIPPSLELAGALHMRAQVENWSIVLLGAWNTAILTPDWLTKYLGVSGPVQIEFPIGNLLMPLRYTLNGVHLVVVRDRVVLAPCADDPEILGRMESFSKSILTVLTHTPVTAIGINFEFIEEVPSPEMKKIFKSPDLPRIADADLVIEATELKRRLRLPQDGVLNLALQQTNGSQVSVTLNFHRDVDGAATAANYLDGRVTKYRALATKFLHDTYELDLGEG
jgi:hypothetical protein